MRMFFLGMLATVVAVAAIGYLVVVTGLMPANADGPYLPGERWAAHTSLNATIKREAPQGEAPLQPTEANLLAGVKIYGDNCVVCHGASDGVPTFLAKGFYQHPPLFGRRPDRDEVGEIYWNVENGIRWTAMPSFKGSLTEAQIWQVALFLKQMKQLPPAVASAWHDVKQPVTEAPLPPGPPPGGPGGPPPGGPGGPPPQQ
jgi:mono/diheme cytochrome c family protein